MYFSKRTQYLQKPVIVSKLSQPTQLKGPVFAMVIRNTRKLICTLWFKMFRQKESLLLKFVPSILVLDQSPHHTDKLQNMKVGNQWPSFWLDLR